MNCRNCGKSIADQAVVCVYCGLTPNRGTHYCQTCGAETHPQAEICVKCGVRLLGAATGQGRKSKLVAGLLGIFLGCLGVHRFYLGYNTIGVAQLVLFLFGMLCLCGVTWPISWLWGVIEGILILVGTINKDADGIPLKD